MAAKKNDDAVEVPIVEAEESISLHCLNERSNKDYALNLIRAPGGWLLNFTYGKHNATQRADTKTKNGPVPYITAKKLYDKIVREQLADGYRVVGGAAPAYVVELGQREHSGQNPQLLNQIEEEDAIALNDNPAWFAQEKHDGERMMVIKTDTGARATNRRGEYRGWPARIEAAISAMPGTFVLDGEIVGEQFRVFDILERDGADLKPTSAVDRLRELATLMDGLEGDAVVFCYTAFFPDDKRALYERLLAANREGIVYKRMDAPYTAGRPNRGGSQLKRKFYETCSCIAGPVNAKDSFQIFMHTPDGLVPVGNASLKGKPAPVQGSVVEIRYLYAYEQTNALAQPNFLNVRTDIVPAECTLSQLKYKSAEQIAAMAHVSPEEGVEDTAPGPRM